MNSKNSSSLGLAHFIEPNDLLVAYRKAKVDMYYERDHYTAIEFAQYEEDLSSNLAALYRRLVAGNPDWYKSKDFVGTYTYIPKSLDPPDESEERTTQSAQIIFSDPDESWRNTCRNKSSTKAWKTKFRIIGRHSIDFHVTSALWILKVGWKFDACLSSNSTGARIRHYRNGEINRHALGSFEPYTNRFSQWRKKGLHAIRTALDSGEKVIALTADLRQFYHEASPNFLLSETFLSFAKLDLTAEEHLFTEHIIAAINSWAAKTPAHQEEPQRGLPVGLSAPRVIANTLLLGFDRFIERDIQPLYYGRYVDDVFLVMRNPANLSTAANVWKDLCSKSDGLISKADDNGDIAYWLNFDYDQLSRLRFSGKKQRVFALRGKTGYRLLDSIERQISEKSSEWRLLPDLPDRAEDLVHDFLVAGRDASFEVDNLRKADGLTVKRLAFSIRLRNLEAAARDLPSNTWEEIRKAFYSASREHIMTVPGWFAYGPYIPRLIGVAVSVGDWEEANALVSRMGDVLQLLEETTDVDRKQLQRAKNHLSRGIYETIIKALPTTGHGLRNKISNLVARLFSSIASLPMGNEDSHLKKAEQLLHADLARAAYREELLDESKSPAMVLNAAPSVDLSDDFLKLDIPEFDLVTLKEFLVSTFHISQDIAIPRALVFPTRPFSAAEVCLLHQESLCRPNQLRRWMRAIRGAFYEIAANDQDANTDDSNDTVRIIEFPLERPPENITMAVTCLETHENSWNANVVQQPDPDSGRYFRINRLINDIIKAKPHVTHVVLPELSLPERWFGRLAHKLAHNNISLIAGLEYRHWNPSPIQLGQYVPRHAGPNGCVTNRVRASLVTDLLGFRSHLIYEQEKNLPAQKEAIDLNAVGGLTLLPISGANPKKMIIRHGEFYFGILICSELTDVLLRARYRGRIDALIVPEWNRDTDSFSAIVEASALDLHCFVVQVNNRTYGDCRIRSPSKERWQRDLARVKGGLHDYFVSENLDWQALRRFQSSHLSPLAGPFKPTPSGFVIDENRKMVP